jgi:hypothetical protein
MIPPQQALTPPPVPPAVSAGGILTLVSNAALMQRQEEQRRQQDVTTQQAQPYIQSLVLHIRQAWVDARMAKQNGPNSIEQRMQLSMLSRRGEYTPVKRSEIGRVGGSDVYVMLTSMKCRSAAALLRDIYLSVANEKAWTLYPTPVPDLSDQEKLMIVQEVMEELMELAAQGIGSSVEDNVKLMRERYDAKRHEMTEEARTRAKRMEEYMEDQLVEGGWLQAINAFLDDITTFPAAILKGPVIRRRKVLQWQGTNPVATDVLRTEFERISPFDIYPSPTATSLEDGYLIERHRLTRGELDSLIGVEGYNTDAIRQVLDEYGRSGLREWLAMETPYPSVNTLNAEASSQLTPNPDGLIDALQFWGTVQGKMLIEWGMPAAQVPDPMKEYSIEAWLIGTYVIKAVLNPDPLARKPYFKASYEEVPGQFWGNSVADIVRDSQDVCNAAARAVVNNMGIASGPQVVVNVDRLPPGEKITSMHPWKIWQVNTDMMSNNTQMPITFFQPDSNVQQLMTIFKQFSDMADEYSGLPKYMIGDGTQGGVGRTATGLSMLIGNAGKVIKQVIANIDTNVLTPLLERLYLHNMLYSDNPEIKGDVQIVARGALSMMIKDTAQLRRNEFLAATANPIDMQIIGVKGRAALLREAARSLDMDPDEIVPGELELEAKERQMEMQLAAEAAAGGAGGGGTPAKAGGETLMNGAPVTDNASPTM